MLKAIKERIKSALQPPPLHEQAIWKPRQPKIANEATTDVFYTASVGSHYDSLGRIQPNTKFGKALQERRLLVAKEVEVNWSGRGQHVELSPDESIKDLPLTNAETIGYSATALVESVRCRRIQLARKSIRVRRGIKLEELINEVEYLHKLRHPHIIQLVGTYLHKTTFALLLYPVATGDLAKFLDDAQLSDNGLCSYDSATCAKILRFILCLAHTVNYIHENGIRHMDIKPANILVNTRSIIGGQKFSRIYITDFGISKQFTNNESSQTDGPTSKTPKYCSPEVAAQEPRGRASDIFSLGCVYAEMLTVIMDGHLSKFDHFRTSGNEGGAYHLTIPKLHEWLEMFCKSYFAPLPFEGAPWEFTDLLTEMTDQRPQNRPNSSQIKERLDKLSQQSSYPQAWRDHQWTCCTRERETYRVEEKEEQ